MTDTIPLNSILAILDKVNIPSVDDGVQFTITDRIEDIRSMLAESSYHELKAGGLSYIFAHRDFDPSKQTILISSHADALYHRYSCVEAGEGELIGTFDNSITNAVLLDLMLREALPPNVLAAFTGDEEHEFRGATETVEFLEDLLPEEPAISIVLDVTAEGYTTHNFTVENLFIEDAPRVEAHFREILGQETLIIPDAAADESWEYDEADWDCFSLCIPTKPVNPTADEDAGIWMHSDEGIALKKQAITAFSDALKKLTQHLPRP